MPTHKPRPSSRAGQGRPRWTQDQVVQYLQHHKGDGESLAKALEKLGLQAPEGAEDAPLKVPPPTAPNDWAHLVERLRLPQQAAGESIAPPSALPALAKGMPRKRRGIEVGPISHSIRDAGVRVRAIQGSAHEPASFAVLFEGAKALTVNALFSVLQVRKHHTFSYKTTWSKAIARAVEAIPVDQRPYFNGPTRLTLYRRAAKEVDLDSLATLFKYAIDALRRHGILADDNPRVIVALTPEQTRGAPMLGLRLEALPEWQHRERGWEPDWFDGPLDNGVERTLPP